MGKDYRNPPVTDAGIWAFILDDSVPLEVAASMRHAGIVTAPAAARKVFEMGNWLPLYDIVFDNGLTMPDLEASLARTLEREGGMPTRLDARALALVRHLQSMDPPRSLASLPLCEEALDAVAAGDEGRMLTPPPYHNLETVTAAQVLYDFDLDPAAFACEDA
jgi:hypothetical protein